VGQLPWREGIDSLAKRGNQGTERFHAIGGRDKDYDGNRKRSEILLVLEMLISRQKDVELARG
jgi:hypothetical protein